MVFAWHSYASVIKFRLYVCVFFTLTRMSGSYNCCHNNTDTSCLLLFSASERKETKIRPIDTYEREFNFRGSHSTKKDPYVKILKFQKFENSFLRNRLCKGLISINNCTYQINRIAKVKLYSLRTSSKRYSLLLYNFYKQNFIKQLLHISIHILELSYTKNRVYLLRIQSI